MATGHYWATDVNKSISMNVPLDWIHAIKTVKTLPMGLPVHAMKVFSLNIVMYVSLI